MNIIAITTYTQALKAIQARIEQGRKHIEAAYEREMLVANWEIGQIINEQLLSGVQTKTENAEVIRQLAGDLKRPMSFVYSLAKFHRYYSELPKTDLSWSHYLNLIRVDDTKKRAMFERKAINRGLSSPDLHGLIVANRLRNKRRRERARLTKPVDGAPVLPCIRGELHYYRCLLRKYIPLKKAEGLIDLGFKFLRKIKTPRWKSNSKLFYVRSSKGKHGYSVCSARADAHKLYTYVATVRHVTDADTIKLNIDLGFDSWVEEKMRLRGINAPEVTDPMGLIAKRFVESELAKVKFVVVKIYKNDKYGRMLADIFYLPGETDPVVVAKKGIFLNQRLLDKGLAELWKKR